MSLSKDCKKYVSKIKKLVKEPKPKKLSGYNVFLKEESTGLNGTAHQRMTKVGAMWKKLSDENKEIWNAKAKKLNKKAVKEFEEKSEELDNQVKELNNFIEETICNFKKKEKSKKENAAKENKNVKKFIEEEFDNFIEEVIVNFKKNLENIPKKCKKKKVLELVQVPVKKKSVTETSAKKSPQNVRYCEHGIAI